MGVRLRISRQTLDLLDSVLLQPSAWTSVSILMHFPASKLTNQLRGTHPAWVNWLNLGHCLRQVPQIPHSFPN
jgi:hypothetical protein